MTPEQVEVKEAMWKILPYYRKFRSHITGKIGKFTVHRREGKKSFEMIMSNPLSGTVNYQFFRKKGFFRKQERLADFNLFYEGSPVINFWQEGDWSKEFVNAVNSNPVISDLTWIICGE